MAYTTIKKPSDYFNTVLYTGNNTTNSITTGFQSDLVWIKRRSNVSDHQLYDSVRGVQKAIFSSLTNAEGTEGGTRGLNAFDSNGFTLGGEVADIAGSCNGNGDTYASWNWKANGAGVANTDGSISSTVSANTTSGFSIVSYSGSNSNSTVGHGLGVAPRVIIIKRLNVADNWRVLHMSAGNDNTAHLNLTAVFGSSAVFQNTSPTSTVFSLVGNNTSVNQSGSTYIAYCFADVTGYSKFGSYVGNGNADGTFIYTGFKPGMVICKKSSAAGTNWGIIDNKRANSFNVISAMLNPNSNDTEGANNNCDFVSNGFKWKSSDGNSNASGDTYIYMAFAEEPLVGDNPATAR